MRPEGYCGCAGLTFALPADKAARRWAGGDGTVVVLFVPGEPIPCFHCGQIARANVAGVLPPHPRGPGPTPMLLQLAERVVARARFTGIA